ncbi:MAG: EscU/YscU/HrcU family type III secretion system export apparatus switch protein [Candidatus Symbiodolus clandestinus]
MSEKTEKPTEKRIRDARKKGQVIKSQELVVGVQLATLLCYLIFRGENFYNELQQLIDITLISLSLPLSVALLKTGSAFFSVVLGFLGGMIGLLIGATLAALMGQVGFLLATEALTLKLDKLNPVNNLKQLFSLRSLFEVGKSLIKIILLGLIFTYILRQYIGSFQFLPASGLAAALPLASTLVTWLWGTLVACYGVFALADYAFQRHSLMKQLRMSKDEITREYKESEGNPEVKSKRREVHREIQSGSLSMKVKKSSVLVKNPSHIAICLYYQPGETPLPQVIEKGVDQQAEQMIALAIRFSVPVVEDVSLARQLLQEVEVDHYIPEHLFEPVAALLRLVMGLRYRAEENRD